MSSLTIWLYIVLPLNAYNGILSETLLFSASLKVWISKIYDLLKNTTYL